MLIFPPLFDFIKDLVSQVVGSVSLHEGSFLQVLHTCRMVSFLVQETVASHSQKLQACHENSLSLVVKRQEMSNTISLKVP